MTSHRETVRIIRVFVSSPSDVTAERGVLDEVVERINRTDGQARSVRLEVFKWETGTVPQIGPKPQSVVDSQMPSDYDIYLGIMKHRFGTPTGRFGSGTEKEFKDALRRWGKLGSPWILFYFGKEKVDPDQLDLDQYTKVRLFREKLDKMGLYATYEGVRGSKDAFDAKIDEHLRKILQLLVPLGPGEPQQLSVDPSVYLRDLLTKTSYINIRSLRVGHERAHRFPIEDLFISLTTTQAAACSKEEPTKRGGKHSGKGRGGDPLPGERQNMPLHEALCNERLVVVGDPGAGKTTFVRRVAHALSQTELGEAPDAARTRLGISERTFPILVRLNELNEHILRHRNGPSAPTGDASPAWLSHYLAAVGSDSNWGLDGDFFRRQLEGGLCTVLLDGLDEAPERIARERLARLIENLVGTYRGCRVVVTSRPTGYTGEARLSDFAHANIDPLSDQAVETFLSRWCGALYSEAPEAARQHCTELLTALRARPDIRRMARNPVMLTALAVLHWNERRLPEQRAELYESIIRWLSRSREDRPGREKAEHTVVLLQELALAMQNHPDGMRTEVPKRWAAERIAEEWTSGKSEKGSITRAEAFVDAEELDSGIVVGRVGGVQFWHRTFQEFLAARAIAARSDTVQERLLWGPPAKVYLPEWREVMLLLAGILHQQGREKVDNLVRAMIAQAGDRATLADKARCAGLLGAMLRDLEPVGYGPLNDRYQELLHQVMGIFDRERSQTVPIETRVEAADALGQAGDPRLDPHRDDYWVTIDAGEFLMGAQSKSPNELNYDPDADEDEAPVHSVYLDSFRIARHPVTVHEYRKFVEEQGYEQARWWQAGGFGEFLQPEDWDDQLQYPSRPVVSVGWYEAAAYCRWAGCRLPTEAEWERAAQGMNRRRYPWGNEDAVTVHLNFDKSPFGHATPVGIYPLGATLDGICDLAGNVWEWCADWYGPYAAERSVNPLGPKKASAQVIRGGSWGFPSRSCRAAYRNRFEPRDRSDDLGFRVALVPLAGRASEQDQAGSARGKRQKPGAKAEGAKRRSPTPRAEVEGG
jgi:formylglycine-generating enzyme required for sulfatase activity